MQLDLSQLQQQTSKEPTNHVHRIGLFQYFSTQGDWQRALTQLQTASRLSPLAVDFAHVYTQVIGAELERNKLFNQGEHVPLFLQQPPQWCDLLIRSICLNATNQPLEADDIRLKALNQIPDASGSMKTADHDNFHFTWISDGDSRLASVIELFINEQYFWIPFMHIKQIALARPAAQHDLIWSQCDVTLHSGLCVSGYMPVRYPILSPWSPSMLNSSYTEWQCIGDTAVAGSGRRMWMSNVQDKSQLDVTEIFFDEVSYDATTSN